MKLKALFASLWLLLSAQTSPSTSFKDTCFVGDTVRRSAYLTDAISGAQLPLDGYTITYVAQLQGSSTPAFTAESTVTTGNLAIVTVPSTATTTAGTYTVWVRLTSGDGLDSHSLQGTLVIYARP